MNRERYTNLDGLRAYACIGIILMHVESNGNYNLLGYIFTRIIPSFNDFVYLFMMISAFSLCCGYFDKFINNSISLEQFYKKRYSRIWPFFALFCTLELLINFSINFVYEWFADLTLVFGLIPNHNIQVVGVGWFLGTIFAFYIFFPFFVFLISNKIRAWTAMCAVIILHYLCIVRFIAAATRENIIFSGIFFLGGGLLYLYRNEYKKISIPMGIILMCIIPFLYYFMRGDYVSLIIFSDMIVVCVSFNVTISKIIFRNKVILFVSSISMEMYLCHMFVYRALEKTDVMYMFDNQIINYMFDSIVTIIGAIALAFFIKQVLHIINIQTKKLKHKL